MGSDGGNHHIPYLLESLDGREVANPRDEEESRSIKDGQESKVALGATDLAVSTVLDRVEFFDQDPHVFVLSWSGRPIFSRYELRDQQVSLVAVISALIENIRSLNDHLISFTSTRKEGEAPTTICFSEKGPVYLAAVSRKMSPDSLKSMLGFVYNQVLLLLSQSAIDMLQKHPTYDLRNLMGGVDKLICSQLDRFTSQIAFEANSVPSLSLPAKARSKLAQSMLRHRSSSSRVLFILLLRGLSLVQLVHSQNRPLPLSDCLLLITFANHMSALENSDIITPICLPEFNSKAFVYAHLSTISDRLYLIQITADSNDFSLLQDFKGKLLEDISSSNLLSLIQQAPLKLPLSSLGVTDVSVRHIVAISRRCGQLISSSVQAPYENNRIYRRICTELHRHTLVQLRSLPSASKIYLESRVKETLVAVRTAGLDVLAIVSSLVSNIEAIQSIKRAASSIQDRESLLFAMKFGVW